VKSYSCLFLVLIVIIVSCFYLGGPFVFKGYGFAWCFAICPHGSLLIDVFKTGIHPLSLY
jgi:hypothetical protein